MDNKLRVFIVEDEAIILGNFMIQIKNMGHEVVGKALNGIDAVAGIGKTMPDIVLMDINIAGKDGITVIEEICEPNMIPVIIITGHFSDELVEQADFKCVYGYLMKPVKTPQLSAAISMAVSRHNDYLSSKSRSSDLEKALEDRKCIEKAKGILMDEFGLKESEAMKRLQKISNDKSKKIALVAKEIILKNSAFNN